MANVLPQKTQKEVQSLRRTRFILTGSIVALTGAFFVFAALLPDIVDFYVQRPDPALGDASITLSEEESTEMEILRTQAILAQFSGISSATSSLGALTSALDARPQGMTFSLIQYTKGEVDTIILQGSADRASISSYRETLTRDPRFETVSIPPEAFAGTGSGRFNITLTGTFH